MKLLGGFIEISSTSKKQYPGDVSGDSIVATLKGSADKGETSQVYGMPGFIGNPTPGVKGIRIRIGSIDVMIAALNYGVDLPENPGEAKVYSTDADGNEVASHVLNNNEEHVFNGGTDFAVAFEDLKAEFELIQDAWDTFASAYAPGGPTSTGTPATASASGANIDNAKVDKIRIP